MGYYETKQLQAPKLNTQSPWSSYGQILMQNAQQGLENNRLNRKDKAEELAEKQRQKLQQDKFNAEQTEKANQRRAYSVLNKTMYPNIAKGFNGNIAGVNSSNTKPSYADSFVNFKPAFTNGTNTNTGTPTVQNNGNNNVSYGDLFGYIDPSKIETHVNNKNTLGYKYANLNATINQNKISNSLRSREIDIKRMNANNSKFVVQKLNDGTIIQVDKTNLNKYQVIAKGVPRTTNELINFKAMQEDPRFKEFIETKLNSKNMGVGLRDANEVKKETNRVSKLLNLNPYQMSTYDFSTLNPQQKYELENLVTYREQGLKNKIPEKMKEKLGDLSAVVYSAGEISKNLNSNDTGLIDASWNMVNQYLGIGDTQELAKRSLTSANYNTYSSFMLKVMSGLAVTKPEEARFIKSFGSLYEADQVAVLKARENMKNLYYRLDTIKKSYDPIVFNARYGHLQRGVQRAILRMDETVKAYANNTPKDDKDFINADGIKINNSPVVQTIRNKKTGKIAYKHADGSISYE